MTSETFLEKTKKGIVLVDFYADWCGPCRFLEPVLDQLQQEFKDKIKFVKVDVEKDQAIALENNVQNLPTMLLFVDGTAKEKLSGYKKLADMRVYLTKKIKQYS